MPQERPPTTRSDADDDPARAAWELLAAVWIASRTAVLEAASAEGLTFAQAKALLHLDAAPAAPMRDLARELQCDASNVTAVADRLEGLGLAARRPSSVDRRVKELVVTRAGRAAARRLRRAMFRPPDAVRALPEHDLRRLLDIARRLADASGVDRSNPFAAPRTGGMTKKGS